VAVQLPPWPPPLVCPALTRAADCDQQGWPEAQWQWGILEAAVRTCPPAERADGSHGRMDHTPSAVQPHQGATAGDVTKCQGKGSQHKPVEAAATRFPWSLPSASHPTWLVWPPGFEPDPAAWQPPLRLRVTHACHWSAVSIPGWQHNGKTQHIAHISEQSRQSIRNCQRESERQAPPGSMPRSNPHYAPKYGTLAAGVALGVLTLLDGERGGGGWKKGVRGGTHSDAHNSDTTQSTCALQTTQCHPIRRWSCTSRPSAPYTTSLRHNQTHKATLH
jgi:hypothetical protein